VPIAVQFDNQLCLEADKIDDVGAYRLLAAEFEAVKAAAPQGKPELALYIGLIASQAAGEIVFHTPHPSRR
jgi:hypothetical protein